jgi:hypothetical protein
MSFTTDDLTAITSAIASGALSVRYADGRSVTYHSIDAMLRVRDLIRADLGQVGDDAGRTHRYGTHSKGLV